jgi:hypothetical protein
MKKHVIWVLTGMFALGFVAVLLAQVDSSKLEGQKPYTPTKLEWLAVKINTICGIQLTRDSEYGIYFVPLPQTNTIVIQVQHWPDVNRANMNKMINQVRKRIDQEAKDYGWDKWLQVKEEINSSDNNWGLK